MTMRLRAESTAYRAPLSTPERLRAERQQRHNDHAAARVKRQHERRERAAKAELAALALRIDRDHETWVAAGSPETEVPA